MEETKTEEFLFCLLNLFASFHSHKWIAGNLEESSCVWALTCYKWNENRSSREGKTEKLNTLPGKVNALALVGWNVTQTRNRQIWAKGWMRSRQLIGKAATRLFLQKLCPFLKVLHVIIDVIRWHSRQGARPPFAGKEFAERSSKNGGRSVTQAHVLPNADSEPHLFLKLRYISGSQFLHQYPVDDVTSILCMLEN